MIDYLAENREKINSWCRDGWEWSRPVSHEEVERAGRGEFSLLLTPTKPVPARWLEKIRGKKVLALASGGGQQGPILTALGAEVTVMDFSDEQLEREREVQRREGYEIGIVQADMTKPLPFGDESFDYIIHPVSNVYVEDVLPIWRECFRVMKPGGYLLAGLDNGINYIVDEDEKRIINGLPFNPLQDSRLYDQCIKQDSGIQFSHSIEEQIGGQLRAGFVLLDLYEDTNGEGRLHELNIPTYWGTLAVKECAGGKRVRWR